MNKNIRRSIAVAAGAAGMWAVGTATASADELPSLSLSTADKATDSVEDTAAEVAEAPAAAAGKAKAAGATAATAGQAEDVVREGAQAPVRTTADQARQYAGSEVAEAGDEIDYLFGPLSSFAPELVDRAPATVQGHVRDAVAHATPVAEEAAQDVLPPIAGRAVDGVLPVAGQAVGDAGGLATGVAGDVAPFADGVLSAVQPFAGDVAGEVQPFAGGVVGSVQPLVGTVVDHVQPVTHGVGGSAGERRLGRRDAVRRRRGVRGPAVHAGRVRHGRRFPGRRQRRRRCAGRGGHDHPGICRLPRPLRDAGLLNGEVHR
ncbi:hypothetical protein QMZ92_06610 [Streptomyces sp. HNM0645]|uniref:hypothetical protein n=1 Tax=Streptomyces sp. HNM0645 TaxID=2782343 RepID=UPI0024B7D178|nr:hypothetical protein [Streptomyces sp. HNM0645]MDI9884075.1 hypothetical protein [Streptomyces sp. HNM0645]